MKRLLSISVLAVFIATACGRSVDLGGDKSNDRTGGEGGQGDDDGQTGGKSFGGVAGAFGGSGPTGGSQPGGNGTGGFSGDTTDGGTGTGGGAGLDPGGAGGVGGYFPGGTGGVGGSPRELPRCITNLYEACWPQGECRNDATSRTVCYEFGVKVVTEPLDNVGLVCFGTRTNVYKADGTPCYSMEQGARQPGCEIGFREWYDADGTLVANESSYLGSITGPSCVGAPTVPCDIGAGGVGTHCQWPTDVCEPGECPYPAP